ncbi:MAG: hypothetical protein V1815_02220 [Candidatus Woesearchaeota archaeon]
MKQTYTQYEFYASIIDKVNYEDIPKEHSKSSDRFKALNTIDFLCKDGDNISRGRKDFGWGVKGKSVYLVGNSMIINSSSGCYDYRTKIICSEQPDTDIVQRYEKFYCKKPKISEINPKNIKLPRINLQKIITIFNQIVPSQQ